MQHDDPKAKTRNNKRKQSTATGDDDDSAKLKCNNDHAANHLQQAFYRNLIKHLWQIFVFHALSKFFGDPLQIYERDLASLATIEEAECFQDLNFQVPSAFFEGWPSRRTRRL